MGISKFGDTRDHTTHTYADHPQIEDEHQRIAKSYLEGMACDLQPAINVPDRFWLIVH